MRRLHASRPFRTLLGLVAALAATVVAVQAMPATAVVGGQVATTTASGVVRLNFFDSAICTGTLWKPNVVITAGHCVVDASSGSPAGPFDLEIWPPGADWTTTQPLDPGPYEVHWNSDYIRQSPGESASIEAIDHAFIVFDQPIGTPFVDRLATPAEVLALSVTQAPMTLTGYGDLTSYHAGNPSNIPMTVTLTATQPYYDGNGLGTVTVATNGVSGGCSGDSGGPWTATILGQNVLVGTDVAGGGPPCNPNGQPTGDNILSVTSGDAGLVQGVLAASGQQAAAVPTTCIAYSARPGSNECASGYAWNYSGCWASATGAVLQQMQSNGQWTTVGPMQVQQQSSCGGSEPVSLVAAGFMQPGSTRYRVTQGRESPDPFTVTVG